MSDANMVNSRVVGAIVGCLVADAAVHNFHGLTDVNYIEELVGDNPSPEFCNEWHNPLCLPQKGKVSSYGEQACLMLETIADNKKFDLEIYKKNFLARFGQDSEYGQTKQTLSGQADGPFPIESIDEAVHALELGEEATVLDDIIFDSCAAVVPLVAFYAGSGEVLELVEKVARLTVNNDIAVQAVQVYAQILEYYLLNGSEMDSIQRIFNLLPYKDEYCDIIHQGRHALKYHKVAQHIYVSKIGSGSKLPVCFMAVIHGLLGTMNFTDGIRAELLGGGVCCLRAGAIGACLGAQGGLKNIPKEWISQTVDGDWYLKTATRLAEARPREPIGIPTKRCF